ncbi:type II secretion system minor pseudopilin GspK [Iodobacter fluviatilis]|uniref:Type II secretion system protein K n=1 Tax=Iodobacter fluviatilis TaxID=537 RepID=A0A377Q7Q0_9NEIS|nr:type II secretion system minor pseudopilin GspK [Iodobacter fluviatilis]TCU89522.1 general secretion pathway protein K [Iodobacter fluviatilis]STQ90892.1 Type II secretory pathway, component PulK [Iodobacter fluviatilis]
MMRKQQGVAIITAVLTAALVTTLAVAIAWRQQLWFRQLENQFDLAEARGIARASINLARLTLRDDARNNQIDHQLEPWNIPIPAIPVETGKVGGRLLEQQGRFNLNNVVQNGVLNESAFAAFQRLLQTLGLPPDIANALVDWLDADNLTRYPGGAEDVEYLAMAEPYRAANRVLLDIQGLSRIRGFTPEVIARLEPLISVLPQATPVNVNFAGPEVLAAIIPGLPVSAAQGVVAKRSGKYFKSIEEFKLALPQALQATVSLDAISIESRYFISEVDAHFGRVNMSFQALLERKGDQIPRIVWLRRR